MARGRSRRYSPQVPRDLSQRSLDEGLPALGPLLEPPSPLSEVEDRRTWHPDPDHGAFTLGGSLASVTVHRRPIIARSKTFSRWGFGRGIPVGVQVPVGIQYAHSFNVINCVRRKVRRQVIFARNKGGKGVKRRPPRRTWRSNIWC